MFLKCPPGGVDWLASPDRTDLGSTSIRHQSDTKVSDWCLIDIDPRVFAIWAAIQSGALFTKGFSIAIQIQWKYRCTVISILIDVEACKKFSCDLMISNWITGRWNFYTITIANNKSLVKDEWVPQKIETKILLECLDTLLVHVWEESTHYDEGNPILLGFLLSVCQ